VKTLLDGLDESGEGSSPSVTAGTLAHLDGESSKDILSEELYLGKKKESTPGENRASGEGRSSLGEKVGQ